MVFKNVTLEKLLKFIFFTYFFLFLNFWISVNFSNGHHEMKSSLRPNRCIIFFRTLWETSPIWNKTAIKVWHDKHLRVIIVQWNRKICTFVRLRQLAGVFYSWVGLKVLDSPVECMLLSLLPKIIIILFWENWARVTWNKFFTASYAAESFPVQSKLNVQLWINYPKSIKKTFSFWKLK